MKLEQLIKNIEKKQIQTKLASIKIGDTVKIGLIIPENKEENEVYNERKKTKQRIQPYEGTIIAQHKAGISTTITVRRIFQNVGIERVFMIHSPLIKNIEIIRRAKVRKAKLYYLRDRIGKSARLKERFN